LRDVVLLDPTRALTARLRDALAGDAGRAYVLTVAAAPPIQLLRDVTLPPRERPPVKRRKPDAEGAIDDEPHDDPRARLEADVRGAIAGGARGLGAVTSQLVAGRDEAERFAFVGRVAGAVARVSQPRGRAERPWLEVDASLLIEEWKLPDAP
jgi:hypothetical protein